MIYWWEDFLKSFKYYYFSSSFQWLLLNWFLSGECLLLDFFFFFYFLCFSFFYEFWESAENEESFSDDVIDAIYSIISSESDLLVPKSF